jgi:hypothetical protein
MTEQGDDSLQPTTNAYKRSEGLNLTRLPDFAEYMLEMPLYPKQREVLASIDPQGSRTAVRWPNGAGKTSMISAPTVLWHPFIYPNSMTITTSSVFRQVKEQMWPRIRQMAAKLKGAVEIDTNQTDFTINHPNGGISRAVGFASRPMIPASLRASMLTRCS